MVVYRFTRLTFGVSRNCVVLGFFLTLSQSDTFQNVSVNNVLYKVRLANIHTKHYLRQHIFLSVIQVIIVIRMFFFRGFVRFLLKNLTVFGVAYLG